MDNETMIDNAHVRGFEKGYKYKKNNNGKLFIGKIKLTDLLNVEQYS